MEVLLSVETLNKIKGKIMSYGKYKFKSFKEFQDLQDLAISRGIETIGEFNKFVRKHFSTKDKLCQAV